MTAKWTPWPPPWRKCIPSFSSNSRSILDSEEMLQLKIKGKEIRALKVY